MTSLRTLTGLLQQVLNGVNAQEQQTALAKLRNALAGRDFVIVPLCAGSDVITAVVRSSLLAWKLADEANERARRAEARHESRYAEDPAERPDARASSFGLPPKPTEILLALATHGPMTIVEMKRTFGDDNPAREVKTWVNFAVSTIRSKLNIQFGGELISLTRPPRAESVYAITDRGRDVLAKALGSAGGN